MSLEDQSEDDTTPARALKELRASERKYRLLIEANDVGYVIFTTDGTILDANRRYAGFTDHENAEEILGHNVCEWVAPQQKETCVRMIEGCLREGHVKDRNIDYVDSKGQVTSIAVNAVVERLAGIMRILALCRDMTSHKQDEDLWRREKQFTDAVFGSAPFLFYEYDDQLRLIRWNKPAESITGYSATELYGKSLFEWFDDVNLPLIREALQGVFLKGSTNVEAYLTMKNGAKVPYYFTAIRMIIDERVFFAGIGVDLTAQKQSEQVLRESEARLHILMENAAVPIVISRNAVIVYANSRYLSMLGYESTEQIMGISTLEQFAPQCREQVREFIQRGEQGLPAPSEYESIGQRADGSQFPVHVAIARISLADGPASLAFITDISNRRKAEETIKAERDSAERYLQIAEVILLALDSSGTITLINRKGCQILGYQETDLIGRNWFELCIPREQLEDVRTIFRRIMAGEMSPYEYYENTIQTKDGRRRIVAWHNSIMRDDSGRMTGTLSSGEDITDRKRAESELAQANEQLRVEREALHEKNIALQELIGQISESKLNMSSHIQSNIDKIVLPILDRLAARLDSQGKHFLTLAQTSLKDIVSPFVAELESRSQNLTQHQIELCDLIRRGLGSKEIAALRGCSPGTVIKQRKVIRKKLGISKKDVNLASFLTKPMPNLKFPGTVDKCK